jgi:SseB protein N-terminal domain
MTVLPIERRLELLIEKARVEPSRVPNLMRALLDAPLVVPSKVPVAKLRALAARGKSPDLNDLFPLPMWQSDDPAKTHWVPLFTSLVHLEATMPRETVWGRVVGRDLFRVLRSVGIQNAFLNPETEFAFGLSEIQVAALAEGRVFTALGPSSTIEFDHYIGAEDEPCGSTTLTESLRSVFATFASLRAAYALRVRSGEAEKTVLLVYLDERQDASRLTEEVAAVAAYTKLEEVGSRSPNLSLMVLAKDSDSPAATVAIAKFRAKPFYTKQGELPLRGHTIMHEVAVPPEAVGSIEPDALAFACPFCERKATVVFKSGIVTHEQPPCERFQLMEPGDYVTAVNARDQSAEAGQPPSDERSSVGEVANLAEKRLELLLERVAANQSLEPLLLRELVGSRVFVQSQADPMVVFAAMNKNADKVPPLKDLEPIPTWDLSGPPNRKFLPIFTSMQIGRRVAGDSVRGNWWSFPAKRLLPLCRGRDICINPGTGCAWVISPELLEELIHLSQS